MGQVAEAERINGQLLTKNFGTTRLSVLAVDTERFHQVAWYRPDFADDRSLEGLIGSIRPEGLAASYQQDGIRLPQGRPPSPCGSIPTGPARGWPGMRDSATPEGATTTWRWATWTAWAGTN